jgi:hypothetical protein
LNFFKKIHAKSLFYEANENILSILKLGELKRHNKKEEKKDSLQTVEGLCWKRPAPFPVVFIDFHKPITSVSVTTVRMSPFLYSFLVFPLPVYQVKPAYPSLRERGMDSIETTAKKRGPLQLSRHFIQRKNIIFEATEI